METQVYTMYEKIILDGIDFEGCEIEANTNFEKVQALFEVFKSEYGFNIDRMGEKRAFAEWLQGLPSSCDIPFMNYDILNRAYVHGLIEANASEEEEDKFLNEYFLNLASAFFTLKNNL